MLTPLKMPAFGFPAASLELVLHLGYDPCSASPFLSFAAVPGAPRGVFSRRCGFSSTCWALSRLFMDMNLCGGVHSACGRSHPFHKPGTGC